MKFLRSIKEFLHPLWRDSYKTDYNSNKTELNQTILDIFDEQLHKVEDETIASKSQSFLKTASDEWLDFWGSWFGLRRKRGQDDESYRQDILEHVKHARSTIPGLRKAISKFLHTSINHVQIYEPYTDVFILNDPKSRLNTKKYLYGDDYYREALIDIEIGVPAPPELIDIINWFRPAGVLWLITYRPSLGDANVWEASPLNARLETELITLDYLIGLSRHLALSLTPDSKFGDSTGGSQPFIINDSLLNSNDLILGGSRFSSPYYGSVGSLNGLITPKKDDNVSDISKQYDLIPYKDTPLLAKRDDKTYPFSVDKDISHIKNLLADTYDFNNWETHVGIVPHAKPWEDNAQILEIKTINSQIISSNVPKLQVGHDYTFSVMARFSQKALVHDAALYVTVDNFKTKLLVTQKLSTDWSVYSVSFTFRNSLDLSNLIFWVEGTLETASSVQVSHFMLNEGKIFQPWSKSVLDYQATLESDYTYIYGAFNVRNFFYDKVLDEAVVKNFLGSNASSETINKYISQYLQRKELSLSYKALSPENTKVSLMMYNFATGFWVPLQTKSSFNEKIVINLSLSNLEQFLNDQGVLVLALKTNTLLEPYLFLLDDLQIKLDRTVKDFAFRMYGEGQTNLMTLVYNMFLGTDTSGNSVGEQKTTPELYDRFEEHYPVRYIRTFTKGIYTGTDVVNQEIYDPDNYEDCLSDYYADPTFNSYNSDFPVESLSIIGASINDKENVNALGNLLPGGVYTDRLLSDWQATTDEISLTFASSLTSQRAGYRIVSNASVKDASKIYVDEVHRTVASVSSESDLMGQGVVTKSYEAFSRSKYQFKFSVQSNIDFNFPMKLRIYLVTNGFRYLATAGDINVSPDLNQYVFDFDTRKIYPDTIEISLTSSTYSNLDISLFDTELILNAQGNFNGVSDVFVPSAVPKHVSTVFGDFLGTIFKDFLQPDILNFSSLKDTVFHDFEGTLFSDLRDTKFKDFMSSISFHDLVFNEGKLPQPLLDAGYEYDSDLDLPAFQDLLSWTDKLDRDIDVQDLINYLQSYIHYKRSQDIIVLANKMQALLNAKIKDFQSQDRDFSPTEQAFTLDLGKVHTDLRYLTLLHGSNSYPNALYTTCLQTSIDGIHWTTWYDNYRGDKKQLDPFYSEKNSCPRKFQLPLYNSLQFRVDEPEGNSETETDLTDANSLAVSDIQNTSAQISGIYKEIPPEQQSHTFILNSSSVLNGLDLIADSGKVETGSDSSSNSTTVTRELADYYKLPLYSSVLSIYPSYELKDLVFGGIESIQELSIGKNEFNVYPIYTSKYLSSPDTIIENLVQSRRLEEAPKHLNVRSLDSDFIFDNLDQKLEPFMTNKSLLNSLSVLKSFSRPNSGLSETTDKNSNTDPNTDDTSSNGNNSEEIKHPFILNKSLLNSLDLILNGREFIADEVPDTNKPAAGGSLLEQHLISINFVDFVSKEFSQVWKILNAVSPESKVAILKYYLLFNTTQNLINLAISAKSTVGWNFVVWDSVKGSWSLVDFTKKDTLQTLSLSFQNIINYLSVDGCLYLLVYQSVSDDVKEDIITNIEGQGSAKVLLDNINNYDGGLYPHKNYLAHANNYNFLQVTDQHSKRVSYALPAELAGKKIVVSFNGLADRDAYGTVSLTGKGIFSESIEKKLICPYSQHYQFNAQVSSQSNPTLEIVVEGNVTSFLLTALKAEIGVEATPYH